MAYAPFLALFRSVGRIVPRPLCGCLVVLRRICVSGFRRRGVPILEEPLGTHRFVSSLWRFVSTVWFSVYIVAPNPKWELAEYQMCTGNPG